MTERYVGTIKIQKRRNLDKIIREAGLCESIAFADSSGEYMEKCGTLDVLVISSEIKVSFSSGKTRLLETNGIFDEVASYMEVGSDHLNVRTVLRYSHSVDKWEVVTYIDEILNDDFTYQITDFNLAERRFLTEAFNTNKSQSIWTWAADSAADYTDEQVVVEPVKKASPIPKPKNFGAWS